MKTNKGISLIVLVITIIIMIILAGSIILTLSNNGIIGKASDAVEKSDAATVNQIAQMGWAEAYAKNITSKDRLEDNELVNYLKEEIKKALEDNGIEPEECGIKVTTNGVKIAKGWLQDGAEVIKGEKTLNVGDKIAYDEGQVDKDVEWQVLGAENGELLILSSTNVVEEFELGSTTDLTKAQNDWLNVESVLAEPCKPYGKGKNATGARSIRLEDINKARGFHPEYNNWQDDGQEFEYGKEVYIYYNGTSKPDYQVTNGAKGKLDEHQNGFYYYNGTDFAIADLSKNDGLITKIKNSDYMSMNIDSTGDWNTTFREMFYGKYGSKDNNTQYWLATSYSGFYTPNLDFGVFTVQSKYITETYALEGGYSLWDSTGEKSSESFGVRAVVSLSADTVINEEKDDNGRWTY